MDPRHVRSRTSSTSSLRSPSALGSGVPPATPSHTPNTATLSRTLGAASSSFGFNNVSPDQLAAGLFRVRAEQGGSRASSIPPTPAPTPNPLLQVNHHMVPEQLGKIRRKKSGNFPILIFFLLSCWNQKDTSRRRLYRLDELSGYSSPFTILSQSCSSYCLQSRSGSRRYKKVTRGVWSFSAKWSFIGGATAYSFDYTGTWQRSSAFGQSQPRHHSRTFAGEH